LEKLFLAAGAPLTYQNNKHMAHSISNITVRQRLTQILIVIILIIAGIIFFSQPAEAQTSKRKKSNVTKQISSKHNSNKACYLLYKKRTSSRNRTVLASASRKPKYKAMAETDQPSAKVASLE